MYFVVHYDLVIRTDPRAIVMVLLGLLGDVHKDNFYLEFKGV